MKERIGRRRPERQIGPVLARDAKSPFREDLLQPRDGFRVGLQRHIDVGSEAGLQPVVNGVASDHHVRHVGPIEEIQQRRDRVGLGVEARGRYKPSARARS